MLVRLRLFEDQSCAALHVVWLPSLLAVMAGTTTAAPFFWCNQPKRSRFKSDWTVLKHQRMVERMGPFVYFVCRR